MTVHEEILREVLPIMDKHDLSALELIGQLNQAAYLLCTLTEQGIQNLRTDLESRTWT